MEEQETKELCLDMLQIETENYMPYAINAAHKLAKRLTDVRKNKK